MSEARDGFLSRWSRLKREGAPEPRRGAGNLPPPAQPEAPELPDGKSLEELLAELPRLEDLAPGQSLTAFMQPWVPAAIRNAALQHMWLLDPQIRDYVDPALDYAYDYNTLGGAPGFGAMDTSPEAMREVAEMFDRALGRDGRQEPAPEAGDNAPQVAHAEADGAAAPQHGLPHGPAVTAVEAGVSMRNGRVSDLAGSQGNAAGIAAHNNDGEAQRPRPARGRHGGALPG